MKEKPKELDAYTSIKDAYEIGKEEGREGLIQDVEKFIKKSKLDKSYFFNKKEWECFKHGKV